MPSRSIPPAVRWAALLWLLVWIPAYWKFYGPANFLRLCDLAIFLSVAGLWSDGALLLSSQALSSFIPGALWSIDALSRLLFGHHLFGGTEYLFDSRLPLALRLLSCFHLVLPIFLLWAISLTGYDPRALSLQSLVAAVALLASRFTSPAANINFAFRDPLFHRALGPFPLHLLSIFLGFLLLCYLPAHLLFRRLFRAFPAPL